MNRRRVRRATAVVLAAVLGAGLLVGCSGDDTRPDDPSPPATDASASASEEAAPVVPGLPADIDYVALGDSYTAGPLVGTMRSDPSGCARSSDNYPAFLAGWLGVATYADVSCSSAVTGDLAGRQRLLDGTRTAPQLAALSEETDLVTLGIGGNDFGIFATLLRCRSAAGCPSAVEAGIAQAAADVQGNIVRAVRSVRRRAPAATVLVVGYPQVLPRGGGCRAVPASAVASGNRVADRLNESLRRGAEAGGAAYVDLAPSSQDHDVCAGAGAWINGPQFRPGVAAPFHPTIDGMRNAAAVVYEQLTGEPAETTETAEPDPTAVVRN